MNFFKTFFFILLFSHINLHADNQALEKVTLQLQWKHQFEFAGFYAAKEKGFYKDAGLDVTFVEFRDSINIVDEVLKGYVNYGLTYSSMFIEYLRGKPLVMLANFFKQSPLVLIAQKEIQSPADLKGKKVMGVSDSIDNITLLTMLNMFEIYTHDITHVPASFNIDDFIDKKVDAMSVYTTNELYQLDRKGMKYNIFDPTAYGAKYYDLNLFTSRDELEHHPERVEKFKNASIRGWKYALAHQEEIIELILQKYNSQEKSKEALRFEAKQIEQMMLPSIYPVGSIDMDRIRTITDSFLQAGFISDVKNKNLEAFVYGYKANPINVSNADTAPQLSAAEKRYLSEKKEIKMCVDPHWMPFESIEKGKHIGLSAEYMQKIQSKIGITIKLIPTNTWTESIDFAKQKKCDIFSLAMETQDRKQYMNFTKPYLTSPIVIATTNDKFFISDIKELIGKKIGLVKEYASSQLLKSKYPLIEFVEVDTVADGLKKVAKEELFGFMDNLASISYQIQQRFPTELKIAGRLHENFELGIGIRNDEPILLSIFKKAMNSIEETTKQEIINHWIAIKYDQEFDYKLFWKILTPFLLLALILLIRQYILRQYNTKLKQEVEQKVEELRQKDEVLIKKLKMAAMGEMLSMIAHQWKQPLGAISSAILNIEIKLASGKFNLDDKNDREKFLLFLEKKHQNINAYVQSLSTTTDDFRNFFNPTKRKDTVFLTMPIEKALEIVQTLMQDNGIEIITDFQEDPVYSLYQNEVMQVVLNLLKNSEDNFLQRSTHNPKITIRTYTTSDHAIIHICDNGGGISKEIIDTIFDPYFSSKDEKNGTGLGLYMSKIMIEDHHDGMLNVTNTDDGVCFEICFKLEVP